MENNSYVVSTLPVKCTKNIKIGALTSVAYSCAIAKKIGCRSTLYLNELSSFETRKIEFETLYSQLLTFGINIDEVFTDTSLYDKNFKSLKDLYSRGILYPVEKTIIRCPCGRVEFLKESVRSYIKGKNCDFSNGYLCKHCGFEGQEYKETVLVIKLKKDLDVFVTPRKTYNNNFKQFNEQFANCEILVSRSRKTGLTFNGFNIDVDFFWSLFINSFSEKNIVIVSSNSHLIKLFLINQLANCFNKNVSFVIHPRIVRKEGEHITDTLMKYDELYRYLFLLYSPKWNTWKCFYDLGMMRFLANLRMAGRTKLLGYTLREFNEKNLTEELSEWIERGINMQKCIQELGL